MPLRTIGRAPEKIASSRSECSSRVLNPSPSARRQRALLNHCGTLDRFVKLSNQELEALTKRSRSSRGAPVDGGVFGSTSSAAIFAKVDFDDPACPVTIKIGNGPLGRSDAARKATKTRKSESLSTLMN